MLEISQSDYDYIVTPLKQNLQSQIPAREQDKEIEPDLSPERIKGYFVCEIPPVFTSITLGLETII